MREIRFCQRLRLIRFTEDALTLERWTPGATTEGTSLRVRHFDGTETDTAEWTHRNALARLYKRSLPCLRHAT